MVRFLLDAHLGRLASYLRMLGVDAAFEQARVDDDELMRLAAREGRVLLTKDRALVSRCPPGLAQRVWEDHPRRQLEEVAGRFGLWREARPFTRCLRCNWPLVAQQASRVAGKVPEDVLARHRSFRQCTRCGRIYWEGSHFQRMAKLLWEVSGQTLLPPQ